VALDDRKAQALAAGLTLYDFGTGDDHGVTPPAVRQAVRDAVPEVSHYPSVLGPTDLRQAIVSYMDRRFGVSLDPETQVLPTSGSKELVFHLPLMVIDANAADRTVVFPDPGYQAYLRGCLFAGGQPHGVPLTGDFRFRPWELPTELLRRTRLMWINSPHNPTGALSPLEHLARTHELCQEHDILLVNDECYADIYVHERPHSLLEVSTEGCLVVHSLSKRSGMTGYRSGFVAGDPKVMKWLRKLRVNPGVVPADMFNAGATIAWNEDSHVALRREGFAAKRQVMERFFAQEDMQIVASEATFYLWIRCPYGLDDPTYARALAAHGIVVCPGSTLGLSGSGAGYVRVALVPDLATCQQAVQVWRLANQAIRGGLPGE
jgi:succinyldiaminopimelate transaminase